MLLLGGMIPTRKLIAHQDHGPLTLTLISYLEHSPQSAYMIYMLDKYASITIPKRDQGVLIAYYYGPMVCGAAIFQLRWETKRS